MKTDVQTLIAALTTERDSIDKAIAALRLIGTEAATATTPKTTRPRAGRPPLSAQQKAMRKLWRDPAFRARQTMAIQAGLARKAARVEDANGNRAIQTPVLTQPDAELISA